MRDFSFQVRHDGTIDNINAWKPKITPEKLQALIKHVSLLGKRIVNTGFLNETGAKELVYRGTFDNYDFSILITSKNLEQD